MNGLFGISPWIKSLRIHDGLFSALFVYIALQINEVIIPNGLLVLLLVAVVVGVSNTMVWNDWYDRKQDKGKDPPKLFTDSQGQRYFCYAIGLWIITGIFTVVVLSLHIGYGMLFCAMMVVAFLYGPLQKIFLAPTLLVSFSVGALMLFPIMSGSENYRILFWSFFILSLFIFCREMVKDLIDMDNDIGHKATIPVFFGKNTAYVILIIITCLILIFMMYISWQSCIALVPLFYTVRLSFKERYKSAKMAIDISIGIFFVVLLTTT